MLGTQMTTVFRPHARVMLLLGQELIRDEVVAVLELVKNSYDADAENVTVQIDCSDGGLMEVRDDGSGMTIEDVQTKLLAPATPSKLARKDSPKPRTPGRGRVTLGDKGVGRFASQRLGRFLEIVTRKRGAAGEVVVKVDWSKYEDPDAYLDEIENHIEVREPVVFRSSSGTSVLIRELKSDWTSGDRVNRLKRALRQLTDPFAESPDFRIELVVNGEAQELGRDLLQDLEEDSSYVLKGRLDAGGRFEGTCRRQNGKTETVGFSVHERVMKEAGEGAAPCGPVDVELYVVEREPIELRRRWENMAKIFGGVSIYRDGFRVAPSFSPDLDWLGLETRRISRLTRLSSVQLFGRCSISHDANPLLKDKTDREGLIDNAQFRYLRESLRQLVAWIEAERIKDKRTSSKGPGSVAIGKALAQLAKDEQIPAPARETISEALREYREEKKEELERTDLMMDLAGLGLAAERASHELGRLLGEIRRLLRRLSLELASHQAVRSLILDIDGFCLELEGELKGLMPLYKAARRIVGEVDVEKVCRSAAFIFRRSFKKHGIDCDVSVVRPLTVRENSGLILQVLLILLDNAVYWLQMKPEGQRRIKVTVDGDARSVVVEDSGPGMEASDLPFIFDAFFSRKPEGRGLGLYIAKSQLAKRGHSIEAVPKGSLGGALFQITFGDAGGR